MGFCRTNLFKRLESSGQAFIQSVERHILRNYVYLHALENGRPCPSARRTPAALDARFTDADTDYDLFASDDDDAATSSPLPPGEGPGVRDLLPSPPGEGRG